MNHPILKHLPKLEAVLFVRHIDWIAEQDVARAPWKSIFSKLTLQMLTDNLECEESLLKGAQFITSNRGRTIATAFHFARRTGLVPNLEDMTHSVCLSDTIFDLKSEITHGEVSKTYCNSFMQYQLDPGESSRDPECDPVDTDIRCLVLFTHGPHCDHFPLHMFSCTEGFDELGRKYTRTPHGAIRWMNLKKTQTGLLEGLHG